jgi:cytochrome b
MNSARVRVWDSETRIVHWLLVALVPLSWWTAERGELALHRYSGYTILGLLVFRLYWALAGSSTARLFRYVRAPLATLDYLRKLPQRGRETARPPGHNPLGALSALVLFALLMTQVGLGLVAVDVDGVESGPLSHLVSFDAGRDAAELHEDLFDVLAAFIGLHIAAVLFYLLWRRENLIGPMITGRRREPVEGGSALYFASWTRALAGAALAGIAVWAVRSGLWL